MPFARLYGWPANPWLLDSPTLLHTTLVALHAAVPCASGYSTDVLVQDFSIQVGT